MDMRLWLIKNTDNSNNFVKKGSKNLLYFYHKNLLTLNDKRDKITFVAKNGDKKM